MKKEKAKILIIEDEPIISSDLEMTLEDLGYQVVGIEDNAEEALAFLASNVVDLILLDINLEGDVDGVMLAEDINKLYDAPYVYLTSNADKLTINRVKRTNPAGFIVKPFTEQDLSSNIEIALFKKREDTIVETQEKVFYIKEGGSLVKVKMEDIKFVRADDNYSRIFTTGKNHVISSTLKKVEEKLAKSNFIRIHRSYIINMHFIDKIKDGFLYIDNNQIPIGRTYHEELFLKIDKL